MLGYEFRMLSDNELVGQNTAVLVPADMEEKVSRFIRTPGPIKYLSHSPFCSLLVLR